MGFAAGEFTQTNALRLVVLPEDSYETLVARDQLQRSHERINRLEEKAHLFLFLSRSMGDIQDGVCRGGPKMLRRIRSPRSPRFGAIEQSFRTHPHIADQGCAAQNA